MRKSFHEQLGEAEAAIVEMAGLSLQQLDRVLRALDRGDEALAEIVIGGDDPIDELYIQIEEKILMLLALQAPVASDLRLVSAILHINIHVERVADLCVNIAKFVKLTIDMPTSEDILRELIEMGRHAGLMLDASIQSFSKRDLELAMGLPRVDDRIDRLNRRIFKELVKLGDESMIEWAARMVLVSRQLERMGDHAVDIGEQVAFMITGVFREFTDASAKDNV